MIRPDKLGSRRVGVTRVTSQSTMFRTDTVRRLSKASRSKIMASKLCHKLSNDSKSKKNLYKINNIICHQRKNFKAVVGYRDAINTLSIDSLR